LFGLVEEHVGPNVNNLEVDDEPSHLVHCKGVEHDFANLAHSCVHHGRPFCGFYYGMCKTSMDNFARHGMK
jgi:hypothetical protein